MILALLLALQDPGALVEQLRSDSVVEREQAARRLLDLGAAARPALEGAAKDGDAEVASRARQVLRRLDLHERLAPRVAKVAPGAVDRLATGSDEDWCAVLLALFASERTVALRAPVEPRDLDFLIARALKGASDPGTRVRLAWTADRYGLRSATPGLLRLLEDPEREPREAAFAVLRGLGSAEILPELLRRVAEEDGERAGTAVDLLVALKPAEAVPALLKTLATGRLESRPHVVRALAGLGAREAAGPIAKLLEDKDPAVAKAAVEAVVALRATEAVPGLRRLLSGADDSVQDAAIRALGTLGAKEAGADLLPLIGEGRPAPLREAAAVALARLGRREAIPVLGRLLEEDPERREVVEALGRLEAPEALLDLLKTIRGDVPEVRRAAIRTLRALRLKEATDALVVRLDDVDPFVREEAIAALTELAGKDAGPRAQAVLADATRSKIQRAAAATLIGRAGYADGRPALRAVLADRKEDARIRRAAAQGLADLGGAGEDLRALLQDPEATLRQAALVGLARLGAREGAAEVLERLKDGKEDDLVREAAARTLGSLGGPESVAPLVGYVADGTLGVEAVEALGRLRAKEALPALFQRFEHPTDPVSREVVVAGERIDRAATLTWLRGLVERGADEVRVRAAEGLCRLGEREGAPVLLEYALASREVSLVALNALRRPDLWKALADRHRAWDVESESSELTERIELLTGLRVDASALTGATFILSEGVDQGWGPVLGILEDGHDRFVLEPDRVRLLPRHEELRFWQDWWRAENRPR